MSKKLLLAAFILALAAVIVSQTGQARAEEAAKPNVEKTAPQSAQPAAPQVAAPKMEKFDPEKLPKVLATVNKKPVDRALFVRIIESLIANSGGKEIPADKLKDVEKRILDQLINREVLSGAAKAAGVKENGKEVDAKLAEVKAKFKTEDEFKKALDAQKLTIPELRKEMAIGVFIENKVVKDIKVTDEQGLKYYNENKDKFKMPEMVRARHIIIMVKPDADEKTKSAAKARIEEAQGKIKAGEKFEDVAKQYSEDGSKSNGGDLGFFPRGAMVKEFEEAAYSMKPGEVSGIVTTQFGFHIIKVEEKKPAGTAPYEEVKAEVVRGLEVDAKREKVSKFIDESRKKAKIKINI